MAWPAKSSFKMGGGDALRVLLAMVGRYDSQSKWPSDAIRRRLELKTSYFGATAAGFVRERRHCLATAARIAPYTKKTAQRHVGQPVHPAGGLVMAINKPRRPTSKSGLSHDNFKSEHFAGLQTSFNQQYRLALEALDESLAYNYGHPRREREAAKLGELSA